MTQTKEQDKNVYVLIGGTACDVILESEGADFRATHDLYMVLIVEALSKEFAQKFWDFIKDGNYEHINKSTGKPQFYRFSKPHDSSFPRMIELFSRTEQAILLKSATGLTPLHIDDEVSSLSAILLNNAYYKTLKEGIKNIDGLSVLSTEYLILFKAKAFLDLSERKAKGTKCKLMTFN